MASANEKVIKVFDPSKSATARKLSALSSQEIFERYFIADNRVSWLKDFNSELNKTKSGTEANVYPYLVSLVGQPLNFIPSYINQKLIPFTPVGYKINSSAIASDLENMLAENVREVRIASTSDEATPFIVQIMEFSIKLYNRGIDYQLNSTL